MYFRSDQATCDGIFMDYEDYLEGFVAAGRGAGGWGGRTAQSRGGMCSFCLQFRVIWPLVGRTL